MVASATLMQARLLKNAPEALRNLIPGLQTDAQRLIQLTRSTPGIAVALVGMGRREHVRENLGVAAVPPLTPVEYRNLFP